MAQYKSFDMASFLETKGMSFSRFDDSGQALVIDPDGNERKFNVDKFLTSKGLDPKSLSIKWNTPDAPSEFSPVSLTDRLKLQAGNLAGQVKYLKNKYEEVTYSEDNGLMIKDKGAWHKVDSSNTDPWELTKDIVETGVPVLASIVGATGTAMAGAKAGAGAGALAGAAIGSVTGPGALATAGAGAMIGAAVGAVAGAGTGGALVEAGRTSLGRLVGTYSATPEEEMADIGYEFLLNAGGEVVGLGVKPALKQLARASKFIKSNAAPAAKETLIKVWGASTGAGEAATRALIENTDDAAKTIAKWSQKGGGSLSVSRELAKSDSVMAIKEMLEDAPKALRSRFSQLQTDLLKEVPDSFRVDVREPIFESMKQMQEAGFGRIVLKEGAEKKAEVGLSDIAFKMASRSDVEKLIASGQFPDRLSDDTIGAVGKYVNEMNKWLNAPPATGKAAADGALKVKRALSDIAFTIKGESSPRVASKLTEFSASLDNKLSEYFVDAGLGDKFKAMNQTYSYYKGIVEEAEKTLNGSYTVETFVNKLLTAPGKQATAKGYAADLIDLIGPKAEAAVNRVINNEAAYGFMGWAPNMSKMGPLLGSVASTSAVASGSVGALPAAALATQASPLLVRKQVEYGNVLLKHMQSMSKTQLAQWMQNPELVNATIQTVIRAYDSEDQNVQKLLQSGGVTNGQQ